MDETDAKRRGSSLTGSSGSLSAPELPASDSQATASKSMVLAALGIGVFGVIVGITGIVMANSASNELAALKQKVEQTQDPATVLKSKFDEIDEHIGNVAADALRANNASSDNGNKILTLAKAIAEDRTQINRLNGHKSAGKPVSVGGAAEKAPAAGASAASGSGHSHTVAAGEHFSSIARQYGVSVAAIEAANPGVDSKHLKVGQQLTIPSGSAAPAEKAEKAAPAASAAPIAEPAAPAAEAVPVAPAAETK